MIKMIKENERCVNRQRNKLQCCMDCGHLSGLLLTMTQCVLSLKSYMLIREAKFRQNLAWKKSS
uniref:Uncharacterized protein n=1 Tax=virus sp. ctqEG8 TaxID=2827998 RepID=A0A8S5RFA7_9VIRU|nr:MAG TPA: hypothetical protein [virus sp. ctqEG8]